jgi:hypothetical protein
MKKKLIMCRLILCCMLLVTAVGTAFARKLGDEKNPNVVLASEHYNMKIHVEKTEIKQTKPYSGLDNKNENLNGEPGDFLQGLIMTPTAIMKVFAENPAIVSS